MPLRLIIMTCQGPVVLYNKSNILSSVTDNNPQITVVCPLFFLFLFFCGFTCCVHQRRSDFTNTFLIHSLAEFFSDNQTVYAFRHLAFFIVHGIGVLYDCILHYEVLGDTSAQVDSFVCLNYIFVLCEYTSKKKDNNNNKSSYWQWAWQKSSYTMENEIMSQTVKRVTWPLCQLF